MNQVFALFAVSYFAVHLPILGVGIGIFAWRKHWLLPTWYWELLICIVPYLIWSLLFWLYNERKGYGNLWEAAMLGGAGFTAVYRPCRTKQLRFCKRQVFAKAGSAGFLHVEVDFGALPFLVDFGQHGAGQS